MPSDNNYTSEILDLKEATIKNVESVANKLTVRVEKTPLAGLPEVFAIDGLQELQKVPKSDIIYVLLAR